MLLTLINKIIQKICNLNFSNISSQLQLITAHLLIETISLVKISLLNKVKDCPTHLVIHVLCQKDLS